MPPEVLARLLFETMPHREEMFSAEPILLKGGLESSLPDRPPFTRNSQDRAGQIMKDLAQVLGNLKWRPERWPTEHPDDGRWRFGTHIQRAPIREIHRGYLEPFRYIAFVENVPDIAALYLMQLPGSADYLDRDNHGVGWHYHYLPDRYTRSDVILSWDTRWQSVQKKDPRPIFQEKHGEGRYKFKAKPWLWGDEKRQSMHSVCKPDLDQWPIEEFRCASNKAAAVWPDNAILTPQHVAALNPKKTKPTKKGHD